MTALTFTRAVATDPNSAFDAWTDPAELARWWWPQWPDTHYELDVRVGGSYRIHSAQVGMGIRGEYMAVDRPDGFTMTWVWVEDGETPPAEPESVDTVQVSFTATDGGTTVTIVHTTGVAAENYRQGWEDVLARLPGVLRNENVTEDGR